MCLIAQHVLITVSQIRNRELNLIRTRGQCVFTWDGSVGLCVCRCPSGGSFRVFTCCQSRRSFILLQLCHPGHRPLAVHMFKLLNLLGEKKSISHQGLATDSLTCQNDHIWIKQTFFLISDITPMRVSTCCLDRPSRGTPSAKVSAPSAPGSQRCLMNRDT